MQVVNNVMPILDKDKPTTHDNTKKPSKVIAQHDEPVSSDLPSMTDKQKQNLPLGEQSDTASSPVAMEEGPKLPTLCSFRNQASRRAGYISIEKICSWKSPEEIVRPNQWNLQMNIS